MFLDRQVFFTNKLGVNIKDALLVFGLATSMFIAACDGSKSNRDISESPQRDGEELRRVDPHYTDHRPSISDDGSKVVFVSGRGDAAARVVFKIYKSTWESNKAPSAPVRLTKGAEPAESVSESVAVLSPSGTWVAVIGAAGMKTDMWLVRFADGQAVRVTNDDLTESHPAFSPDEEILSWSSYDLTTMSRNIKLVSLTTAPSTLPAAVTLTKNADAISGPGFWQAGAVTPYIYVTQSLIADQPMMSRFDKRSFNDLATVATTQPVAEAWLSAFPSNDGYAVTQGGDDKTILVRNILPPEAKRSQQSGDLVESTKSTRPVETEIAFAPYDGTPQLFLTLPGVKIHAADINQAGDLGFWVEREFFLCKASQTQQFGSGLVTGAPGASEFKRYIPLTGKKVGTWEVTDNFCKRQRADKTLGLVDTKVTDAVVAASGNATAFRAVYVTRFSSAYNAACSLQTGDLEVMALDVTVAKKTIYPLSKNAESLQDEDRAGKGACK